MAKSLISQAEKRSKSETGRLPGLAVKRPLKRTKMTRSEILKIYNERRSLSGANLSGADLSGADLDMADLSEADLSEADLSEADLPWANLSRADLSGANLSGANLHGANLYMANLSGADLDRADLTGANLYMANLSGAYLSRAKQRIVSIYTTRHQIIAIDDDIKIGCYRMSLSDWLKNYESIGMKNEYSKSEIELYGKLLKSLL